MGLGWVTLPPSSWGACLWGFSRPEGGVPLSGPLGVCWCPSLSPFQSFDRPVPGLCPSLLPASALHRLCDLWWRLTCLLSAHQNLLSTAPHPLRLRSYFQALLPRPHYKGRRESVLFPLYSRRPAQCQKRHRPSANISCAYSGFKCLWGPFAKVLLSLPQTQTLTPAPN